MRQKVTNLQAMDFFRRWNQGEFPQQRMGQAFLNHFGLDCHSTHGEHDFCLFNHEHDARSTKQIWEEWVDG